MSISTEVRLHEALRRAHGLPHHVKQWLASQPSKKFVGLPAGKPADAATPAAAPAPRTP